LNSQKNKALVEQAKKDIQQMNMKAELFRQKLKMVKE